jgi:hypothetical protein
MKDFSPIFAALGLQDVKKWHCCSFMPIRILIGLFGIDTIK